MCIKGSGQIINAMVMESTLLLMVAAILVYGKITNTMELGWNNGMMVAHIKVVTNLDLNKDGESVNGLMVLLIMDIGFIT